MKKEIINLSPHHFYDIIRFYGAEKDSSIKRRKFFSFLKNNFRVLRPRQLIVFCVSLARHLFKKAIGKTSFLPHPNLHQFHEMVVIVKKHPSLRIRMVIGIDDVCKGCIYNKDNHCHDVVSFLKNNPSLEEFNKQLDKRIMKVCNIKEKEILTPIQLLEKGELYLNNLEYIYSQNDDWHTKEREEKFKKGLQMYIKWHNLGNII